MARQSLKSVMRLIEQTKKELPPEQMFLSELKRSIELDDRKNSRKPSQYYKPSSLKCIRNMYYQRIGANVDDRPADYILVGICNSGSDIHIRIQQALEGMRENGIDLEYVDIAEFLKKRKIKNIQVKSKQGMETKLFHKDLQMSFLTDGIIRYQNHYYIFEAKTETSNKFWSRDGVDPAHYEQAIAYSIAFGLDEVIFLYISRDTLDMKSFLFKVTGDMKQELIGKIENCEEYVQKKIVPLKPKDVDRKTCEYCGYKALCRRDT